MEANYVRLNPEDIEEKLKLRKGNIETFTILSLLYPNLKKELELDKDHLHPFNICENRKLEVEKFDSIVNLQLLVSGENRAKKNKPLDIWINEQCNGGNRKKFLEEHLIPDVDLSIENFDDFYEKRKILASFFQKGHVLASSKGGFYGFYQLPGSEFSCRRRPPHGLYLPRDDGAAGAGVRRRRRGAGGQSVHGLRRGAAQPGAGDA